MAQDPLHLLCIEPRFPGRLGAVADWLVRRRGYRCRSLCAGADAPEFWPASAGKGLDVFQCPVGGDPAVEWTRVLERGLGHALSYWAHLDRERPRPIDLVLGRSAGLGSTLFVPAYLPRVPLVNLFDYFYHARAHDLAEEIAPHAPSAYTHWRRAANAMDLLDLENGGTPWVPTRWQRDLYPAEYRDDFLVLHDGIDTARFRPLRPPAREGRAPRNLVGRTLLPQVRVVTFVARALDRLRGFDRFMELANRLLRARPDVLGVVVGHPVVQRGLDVQFFNQDYRAHVLGRMALHDPDRVWFFEPLRPGLLAEVLALSDLHVYPSRPYPVARSLLEAMASGCVVLAADTAPVREFVTHGRTGLLAEPADADAWERQALAVLQDPAAHRPLGDAAGELIRRQFAQDVTLPTLAERFTQLANA
jgi:glycosyltransferase involved in cell wall biosynthesis